MHCKVQVFSPVVGQVGLRLRPLREEEALRDHFLIIVPSGLIYLITGRQHS